MLTKIGIVLLLAMLNGFFALSELAVVASRKSRLKHMARTSRQARVALLLSESPERFLSTVQVGITVLMLITGAVAGESIGEYGSQWLRGLGIAQLAPYLHALGLIMGLAIITVIQVVVGELVPKRAALVAPERVATIVATPMLIFSRVSAPFVWLLNELSTLILKALRLDKVDRGLVSEEEIRMLVAESAEQGVLDSDERNMVNRVLRLGDRSVDSVMTPRKRITWLDIAAQRSHNLAVLRSTPYSRYPVYRENENEILGVLEVKSLLDSLGRSEPDLFRKLAKPLYVPATARALDLLEEFRDAETPLALVVDEYGDIEGLVTLNDLLAAVVGKSSTATSPRGDTPVVRREDGSYLVDGSLSSDDLRELLQLVRLPNEDEHDYRTVAGMMMAQFGRIPPPGDFFQWRGIRFEVMDLDGARIDKILVVMPHRSAHGDEH